MRKQDVCTEKCETRKSVLRTVVFTWEQCEKTIMSIWIDVMRMWMLRDVTYEIDEDDDEIGDENDEIILILIISSRPQPTTQYNNNNNSTPD